MTLPKGYDKNNNSNSSSNEKAEPSRTRIKAAQIIGIILLIIGILIFFRSLGAAASVVGLFFSIILIVISLIIILTARRSKTEGQTTINVKTQSKAIHRLVIFLYFLAAVALCYGLYSEYWLAGESLMESIGSGFVLLIIAGRLDEHFGTILWFRDIFSNRQKKR